MKFIKILKEGGLATIILCRNKVNALNGDVLTQLRNALNELETDPDISALIFTGENKFFSFGFDIPHFLSYSKEEFSEFLTNFAKLYTYMFTFPKPVIAAINGHAIAGGCMLALACDYRIMVDGNAKISLNEITFGASVFSGSTEMLRFCVGSRTASEILYSGTLYSASEAKKIGLIDRITSYEKLKEESERTARKLGTKPAEAFKSLKLLLRKPVAEIMKKGEKESIKEFVDIWYSDSTFENLKKIKIY